MDGSCGRWASLARNAAARLKATFRKEQGPALATEKRKEMTLSRSRNPKEIVNSWRWKEFPPRTVDPPAATGIQFFFEP